MDKLQEVFEQQFAEQIKTLIDEALTRVDIAELVENTVSERFNNGNFQQYINDTIQHHVNSVNISETAVARLEQNGQKILQSQMPRVVRLVQDRIDSVMSKTVDQKLKNLSFPERSIDPKLIDVSKLNITRANIQDFGNTDGIEDMATGVQLTVMDDCVVVEDRLVTKTLQADTLIVKDFATDQPWYAVMKQDVLASVPKPVPVKDWSFKVAEIEARISVNEKRNNLNELEVSGEALLSDVLYTTPGNKRVGINTMDPSDALTVWDQECEVVIGKHASQEGYIGTRRRQDLNIGANNAVGLKIRSDGTVVLDKLELQGKVISSSGSIPGHAAKRGDIVLNTKPVQGGYIGWVCLDGLKWTGFGKIE
jgi:hypothetical protein